MSSPSGMRKGTPSVARSTARSRAAPKRPLSKDISVAIQRAKSAKSVDPLSDQDDPETLLDEKTPDAKTKNKGKAAQKSKQDDSQCSPAALDSLKMLRKEEPSTKASRTLACAACMILASVCKPEDWGQTAQDSTSSPGQVTLVCVGDACKKCLRVWQFAWRLLLTWIEFCRKVRTDKNFEAQFQLARNTLAALEERAFHAEQVVEKMACGRRVGRQEIYASAADLRKLWKVKRIPNMRDVPRIYLPMKSGQGYEELFVFDDPREPLRTGESFQTAYAERDLFAMAPHQHLHSEQGKQVFSKVLQAGPGNKVGAKNGMTVSKAFEKYVQKDSLMHDEAAIPDEEDENCTDDDLDAQPEKHDDLDDVLFTATGKTVKLQLGAATMARLLASMPARGGLMGGSELSSSSGREMRPGETLQGAPGTPQAGPEGVASTLPAPSPEHLGSNTGATSPRAGAIPQMSPNSKAEDEDSGEEGEDDDDNDDGDAQIAAIVQRRIDKMPLAMALQGKKLGRSLGPARDLEEKLKTEELFRSEYNRLKNHLRAVETVQEATSLAKVLAMLPEEFSAFLEVVEKHAVDLNPPKTGKTAINNIKEWLVVRRLTNVAASLISAATADDEMQRWLDEFWDVLRIWMLPGESAGFDIHHPRMRDIVAELSPPKAVKTYYKILIQNFFIPVLTKEGGMSRRMFRMATESTKLLDSVDCVGLEKSFVDVVLLTDKLFKTVKVGLLECLPYDADDLEDVEAVMKHAGAQGKSPVERFADAVQASDFYRDRVEKAINDKAQLIHLSSTYCEHEDAMRNFALENTVEAHTSLQEMAKHIVFYKENAGAAKVQILIDLFLEKVRGMFEASKSEGWHGDGCADGNLFQNTLQEASVAAPECEDIADMQEAVAKRMRQDACLQAWGSLQKHCAECKENCEAALAQENLAPFKLALGQARQVDLRTIQDSVPVISDAAQACISYMQTELSSGAGDLGQPSQVSLWQTRFDVVEDVLVMAESAPVVTGVASASEVQENAEPAETKTASRAVLGMCRDFVELRAAAAGVAGLGSTVEEKLGHEGFKAAEKKLHAALEKCHKTKIGASLLDPFSVKVEACLTAAQAEVDAARDLATSRKEEALKEAADSLAKIASGGPGGEDWHKGLQKTATFLQVKKQLEDKVPKVTTPANLTEKISKAAAAEKAYVDLAEAYGVAADSQAYKDCAQVLKTARTTNVCLCIVGHIAGTSDLKARGDKVRAELVKFRHYEYDEATVLPDCMTKLLNLATKEKKIPGA